MHLILDYEEVLKNLKDRIKKHYFGDVTDSLEEIYDGKALYSMKELKELYLMLIMELIRMLLHQIHWPRQSA